MLSVSFVAPAFTAPILCATSLYRPLGPHSSNHRPLEHLGAGGYITADVTVIIRALILSSAYS